MAHPTAHPLPVEVLADLVRERARSVGGWPSIRRVMADFRVGRPKAVAALDTLRADGFDPAPAAAETHPDAPADAPRPTAPDTAPETTNNPGADEAPTVPSPLITGAVDAPATEDTPGASGASGWRARWPVLVIALGAFVAIWSGWVGLGELTGFGPVRLLPGIVGWELNTAIVLPLGVEAYAALALRTLLAPPSGTSRTARRFAGWSAGAALVLGAAGQIAYHVMTAQGVTSAPWQITAAVSCLPVAVLGAAAALDHLTRRTEGGQA